MTTYTTTYDMNVGDVIKAISLGNTKARKYVITNIYYRSPKYIQLNVQGQRRVVLILESNLASVEIISRKQVGA